MSCPPAEENNLPNETQLDIGAQVSTSAPTQKERSQHSQEQKQGKEDTELPCFEFAPESESKSESIARSAQLCPNSLLYRIWSLVTYTPHRCRWDPSNPVKFSWALTVLFGFATTFTVANLYYNTPLLTLLASDFTVPYERVTQIPTVMQAGYAVGLVFLCPLGDLVRRRPFTLLLTSFTAVVWLGLCLTDSFECFVALSFVAAVSTVTPQIMLPLIGDIAPPSHRATAISLVSSGLLLGLLIARVLAGIISQYTSWRNIYWLALGLQVCITIMLWAFMPDYPATMNITKTPPALASASDLAPTSTAQDTSGSSKKRKNTFQKRLMLYPSILWSIITLFISNPTLIQASLMGFCFSVPYTSFWTTLTFLLSAEPYSYSTLVIGLFAVVGILPMAFGPVYSRLVLERSVPLVSALVGVLFCLVGALVGIVGSDTNTNANFDSRPRGNIAGPIIQCILLDLGQQVALTACRVTIYESAPGARSRVNTAFVLFLFGGEYSWDEFGWVVTEVAAVGFAGLAIVLGGCRGPQEEGWVGWGGGWGWRRVVEEKKGDENSKEDEESAGGERVRGQVRLGVLVQSGEGGGDDDRIQIHNRATRTQ
ncbi:major facilitator superfamily transporter [Penicillium waksmanii]|uniref:major facilitator superfamily transporter n=1 Tax=Penicillium waksmanii TaxID=69791 RepID=UPI002548AE42|nr:major facilitator superfamily transporter [Penicillium waksmanii]KAJ5999926.1 major facilitator superfamily transporter [Penicillium waksmanii]